MTEENQAVEVRRKILYPILCPAGREGGGDRCPFPDLDPEQRKQICSTLNYLFCYDASSKYIESFVEKNE